ncbi:unnamed protein product, partial [Plutella xylostella]
MYAKEITVTVLTQELIINKVTVVSVSRRAVGGASERRDVDVAREGRVSDERHALGGRVALLVRHVVHVDDVRQVRLRVLALHAQLLLVLALQRAVVLALEAGRAGRAGRHGLRLGGRARRRVRRAGRRQRVAAGRAGAQPVARGRGRLRHVGRALAAAVVAAAVALLHLRHVVARVVLLLVGRRVVHHVPVGHVAVGRHLVHVALLAGRARLAATAAQQRAAAQRVLVLFLGQSLRLPARPVLVVGVLLHVHGAQALRLVDEGALLRLGQVLPLRAEALGDLGVVHLGVVGRHLPALAARPHHEGVHGALDAVRVGVLAGGVVVVVGRRVRGVCGVRGVRCVRRVRGVRVLLVLVQVLVRLGGAGGGG